MLQAGQFIERNAQRKRARTQAQHLSSLEALHQRTVSSLVVWPAEAQPFQARQQELKLVTPRMCQVVLQSPKGHCSVVAVAIASHMPRCRVAAAVQAASGSERDEQHSHGVKM